MAQVSDIPATPTQVSPTDGTTSMDLFTAGLYESYALIFFSEIGDKTFFMITCLSTKFNRFLLFIFAALAMNIMNAVSVLIGAVFPLLMPRIAIQYLCIVLFLGFGLKLIYNCIFYTEAASSAS